MIKHLYRVVHAMVREATKARSSEWRGVRRSFLKLHATCAACGSTSLLQVHHVDPFLLDPAKELDPTNLITLCMSTNECHLRLGHGDDWQMFNPNIRNDAQMALAYPDKLSMIQDRAKQYRQKLENS